jgi:tRNA (adenine22-N1)-methyltransferase
MDKKGDSMNLSERLICIAKCIPDCNCLADIGTDHGYIPIYIILNNISKKVIAGDIKKGPIEIANKNILNYKLEDRIETRIGPGLSVLKKSEADVILIAGMGGNLIADIIEEKLDIATEADCLILQPVQYPEVLRKYLSKANFNIFDEELAKEGNKYYHIIKAKKGTGQVYEKEVYYYTGLSLLDKRHPILIKYVNHKIHRINIILRELANSNNIERKSELIKLKEEFEEVSKWLNYVVK